MTPLPKTLKVTHTVDTVNKITPYPKPAPLDVMNSSSSSVTGAVEAKLEDLTEEVEGVTDLEDQRDQREPSEIA